MPVLHSGQFQSTYQSEYGSARVTPEGYVHNVFVPEGQRGRGHGAKVMGKILADADRIGKPLTLHAREDLHDWYGALGFKVTGRDVFGPRLERQPREAT